MTKIIEVRKDKIIRIDENYINVVVFVDVLIRHGDMKAYNTQFGPIGSIRPELPLKKNFHVDENNINDVVFTVENFF